MFNTCSQPRRFPWHRGTSRFRACTCRGWPGSWRGIWQGGPPAHSRMVRWNAACGIAQRKAQADACIQMCRTRGRHTCFKCAEDKKKRSTGRTFEMKPRNSTNTVTKRTRHFAVRASGGYETQRKITRIWPHKKKTTLCIKNTWV